jgi:precorrin-6B methylase 1
MSAHFAIVPRAWGHIQLASNYGLDAYLLGRGVELDRSVHIAVIGHGDSRLAELMRPLQDIRELISSIQEAVLRMKMEVNELRHAASTRDSVTILASSEGCLVRE